jgi:hypothetical protein
MVKYAINEGFISGDPFYEYKPVYPRAKQKYLTLAELESIIHTPFEEVHLALTRDMFLFSCFTGLAYVDFCKLSEEHLKTGESGNIWICIEREKSKTECNIPLMKLPLQIMEKYRYLRKDGKLFKTLSSGSLSNYFRKLERVCNVKHLSFHAGRHRNLSFRMKMSKL